MNEKRRNQCEKSRQSEGNKQHLVPQSGLFPFFPLLLRHLFSGAFSLARPCLCARDRYGVVFSSCALRCWSLAVRVRVGHAPLPAGPDHMTDSNGPLFPGKGGWPRSRTNRDATLQKTIA
nr:hypothetical protein [Pandoravirus massiliensis]